MAHPYYPRSLALPLYTAPVYSQSALIVGMASISIAVLALAWQIMTKLNPSLSRRAKATASWFLYCGLLHVHFEGYFIKYRRTLAGRDDFVANLWKEYTLSDSRYLAQDTFVVGIEALTVLFLGPLCLLTFLAIVLDSPKRHPARLLACCCHIYGCLLYFVTSALDRNRHCRPEALYYWVYYLGFNLPWIIVPAVLGWRSFRAMTEKADTIGVRKFKLR